MKINVFALAVVALLGLSVVTAYGFNSPNASEEDRALFVSERDSLREAVESNDYDAWKIVMQERLARLETSINEESFNALVVRHEDRVALGHKPHSHRDSAAMRGFGKNR